MDNDIDTPPGLEISTHGVPPWLVFHIKELKRIAKGNSQSLVQIDDRIGKVETHQVETNLALVEVKTKLDMHLQEHKGHEAKNNPRRNSNTKVNSNKNGPITFKWLIDNLVVPPLVSVITTFLILKIFGVI